MKDSRLLTRRQIRALDDGSIIRVPAAVDVKGGPHIRLGNFRVERVDEDGDDPVGQLLARFSPDEALSLFAYVTKILRLWDGEAAVQEGFSSLIADGVFLIPAPPPPDEAVQLIYARMGNEEVLLLGGYLVDDTSAEVAAAIDEAQSRRLGVSR